MDISIPIDNTLLNIRVALILKTEKGIILEKSNLGYSFLIGGRIKINETGEEAIKREVFEELGFTLKSVNLKAVIENFYKQKEKQVHELCFVFTTEEICDVKIPENFCEYSMEEIKEIEIKPAPMKKIIESKTTEVIHIVERM